VISLIVMHLNIDDEEQDANVGKLFITNVLVSYQSCLRQVTLRSCWSQSLTASKKQVEISDQGLQVGRVATVLMLKSCQIEGLYLVNFGVLNVFRFCIATTSREISSNP